MTYCPLVRIGDGDRGNLYCCDVCGRPWDSPFSDPALIHRRCPGVRVKDCEWTSNPAIRPANRADTAAPGVVTKGVSLATATARWIAAGSPVRTADEIAAIYEVCHSCEQFKPGNRDGLGSCRKCGCKLRRVGGLMNKIKMATEHCPLEKW